jgi:hypothetical protein
MEVFVFTIVTSVLDLFFSEGMAGFNARCKAAYDELLNGIDKNDKDARKDKMGPIIDELEMIDTSDVSSQASPITRMKGAQRQLVMIVSTFSFEPSHFLTQHVV